MNTVPPVNKAPSTIKYRSEEGRSDINQIDLRLSVNIDYSYNIELS